MFTPQISNPNKNNVAATEIQLGDRLITNSQLKDFFVELPKRLELVEEADDTANNVDVMTLVNDVEKNKTDIEYLKPDVENINERLTELDGLMGEKTITGTVQYRLNEISELIYNSEGMIWMINELNDGVVYIENNLIPEIRTDVNYNTDRLNSHTETLLEIENDVSDVKNKLTQIDVNTAEMKVVQAQVVSMLAQIEQIRTECNNKLATCFNAIEAIDEQLQTLKRTVNGSA